MGIEGLPPNHGEEREEAIRKIVCEDGDYDEIEWENVVIEAGSHRGEFLVMADALKIDGVRVNVTAETQQHIADALGCCLPTAKILDEVWQQRSVTLQPSPQSITSTTQAMKDHSDRIDKQLAALGNPEGLLATVGKHWILDNGLWTVNRVPLQACNYGWHFRPGTSFQGINGNVTASLIKDSETGQYVHMIQTRGWHHDQRHVDYSQVCRLVANSCRIDGALSSLPDVLVDPELSSLVSVDGALPDYRHPNVERVYKYSVPIFKMLVDVWKTLTS